VEPFVVLGTHQGVQVARRGATFEDFYAEQVHWARRLAFVLLGDGDDRFVDDVVQDALLSLRPRFAQVRNPRAYLRVTIVNGVRRHRRRERTRERAQELSAARLSNVAEFDVLLERIDRLPERQRMVLVLRYFENLSEAEIAETLSCRPGTVKSLAARALQRLREEW
jgi:RNA polymerase sigma factor (sigma-70 family)